MTKCITVDYEIEITYQSFIVLEGKKMEEKCLDKMINKFCKIVTKEPGEDRAHVVFGKVTEIDWDEGLLFIESEEGIGCLNIETIEAIKPNNKKI
jgi:hypothetical protein